MNFAARLTALAILTLAGAVPAQAQYHDGCATCGPCKSCCDVWDGWCEEVVCCPCCGHRQGGIRCRLACFRLKLFKPRCDCHSCCESSCCETSSCTSCDTCTSGGVYYSLPDAMPGTLPPARDELRLYEDDSPGAPPTPLELEGSRRPTKKASLRRHHPKSNGRSVNFQVAPAGAKAR